MGIIRRLKSTFTAVICIVQMQVSQAEGLVFPDFQGFASFLSTTLNSKEVGHTSPKTWKTHAK